VTGPGGDGGPTATGLAPRTAAALAYAAWWLTGAFFLIVEPRHPFVRFHARQALVAFGALWLAGLAFWAVSFVGVFVWPPLLRASAVAAQIIWGTGVVLWGACLVQAYRGRWWALPGVDRVGGRRRRG
jgi:uncharacterized membrane protein